MPINISTIIINASKQKVWDAVTKPELVKLWQYGSDLQTNWQIGSTIRFTTAWGDKIFEQWGKVLDVEPLVFLKYSLFAPRPDLEDKPENYFVISYILTEIDDKIKLDILQEDNRPNAVQEAPQGGENPVLAMLQSVAER